MPATESAIVAKIYRADGSILDVSDHVYQYQGSQSVKSIGSWTLALPLRYKGKPLLEQTRGGDLVEIGFLAQPNPTKGARYYTRTLGILNQPDVRQATTRDGVQQVAILSGRSLAGWLSNETINYYLAAVLSGDAKRVLGAGGVDNGFQTAVALKNLDQALAAYLERVLFRIIGVQRPQGNIDKLLGYGITTLEGTGAYYQMWANFEGTPWGFLETYSDRPLHELYAVTLPLSKFQQMTRPTREGKQWYVNTPRAWGEDRAVPALIVRPSPFPYALPGGGGSLGDWPALPLHDFTAEGLQAGPNTSMGSYNTDKSVNVFYIYPSTLNVSDVVVKTFAPVIIHEAKYRRHGYKPLTFPTQLWANNAKKEDAPEYFRRLNWRVAGQNNRLDEMLDVTLSGRFMPWVLPGERARFWGYLGDEQSEMEGYIEAVTDVWSPNGERSTQVQVTRGLPKNLYQTPSYFANGLSEYVPVKATDKDTGRTVIAFPQRTIDRSP